jgi:hypothetical protein
MGVRALAKHLSVSPSTVTRWRKSSVFRERVDFHRQVWGHSLRDDYFKQIRKDVPTLSEIECFRQAFQLYATSIPLRRAGKYRAADESSPRAAPVLPKKALTSRVEKSRKNSDSESKR